jgi:membrane protein
MADTPSERAEQDVTVETWARRRLETADRWARVGGRALRESFSPESQLVASSIAFFTLFSVFPLVLLVIAIGSNWLDPLLIEARLVEQLEFAVPAMESLLGSNLESLASSRGSVTGIALLSLFWSATSIFNVLTRVMDRIWGANINHVRSVWRHRGLAIIAVLILTAALLLISSAEGTVVTVLNSLLPDELATLEPLTTEFWSILLSIGIFAILYYFLPHVRLHWRSVMAGAIVAALLWEVAKRLYLFFIAVLLSRTNLIYGSVTSIIVFLGWTYASSLILLFGAYMNRDIEEMRQNGLRAEATTPDRKPTEAIR